MADPATWFLKFAPGGQGRPWGDGTAMAGRLGTGDPWDEQCEVTPYIGGYAAMLAIRETLEQTIVDAKAAGGTPGQVGHVYIAGWRFNAQRDLSDDMTPWISSHFVAQDQTALGLVLRLMDAGVRVRIMVWLPTVLESLGGSLGPHVEDHYYLARAVQAFSDHIGGTIPVGVVALDARTAEGSIAGTHHQKTMVIRGLGENQVAFCGGVDLGYTRRDGPATVPPAVTPAFLDGDWQSSTDIPVPGSWPRDHSTIYASLANVPLPSEKAGTDLPEKDLTDPTHTRLIYGTKQIWHDQHLKLRGPIVQTLEDQFAERWKDTADLYDLSEPGNTFGGQVIFSSPAAIAGDEVVELETTAAPPPLTVPATSAVQMWRTIPWRDARTGPPFQRAEFTVMSGVSNAVQQAQHLIWIFDQYFWSMPLAHQLNFELTRTDSPKPDLRVIVILPPYADAGAAVIHEARRRALEALCAGAANPKVAIYNLWDHRGPAARGIYVHAKTHTYDGGLLVCGSANLNRRSFLCDSELACAVADENLVKDHQKNLWNLLFREVTGTKGQWPPGMDLTATGSNATPGATFFDAFNAAAGDSLSYLSPDPWAAVAPALPNGVVLPRGQFADGAMIDHIYDPTSVDPDLIEGRVDYRDANAVLRSRPPRLAEVVARLEATVSRGATVRMPNRRQSSEFRLPLSEVDLDFGDIPI